METCSAVTHDGKPCRYRAKTNGLCGIHAKPATQCRATSKSTGQRCANPPLPGGYVCRFHGGKAPQVVAKAARRVLEELTGPAMSFLAELVRNEKATNRDRLAAARDILDRNGYKPPTQVEGRLTLDMI